MVLYLVLSLKLGMTILYDVMNEMILMEFQLVIFSFQHLGRNKSHSVANVLVSCNFVHAHFDFCALLLFL
jgi:hypothetical protein